MTKAMQYKLSYATVRKGENFNEGKVKFLKER
jgi:hypothetical protein